MILQEATYFKYGYYPYALSPKSAKKIIAACDGCGKVRVTTKGNYHALCHPCSMKGKTLSEDHKRKISEAQTGRTFTEDSKQKMSKSAKSKTLTAEHKRKIGEKMIGEKAYQWKGGAQVANARQNAKRKHLGFTPVNAPFEDSEGHHMTHNSVVYIPHFLHHSIAHNIWTAKNMYAVNALAIDFLLNGF